MRYLDVYDIKVLDTARIKSETRKIVNESLKDLEVISDKLLSSVIVSPDVFQEYVSLFDKIYVVLDFMHLVGMVNRIVYQDFMNLLSDLDKLVREKVESFEKDV